MRINKVTLRIFALCGVLVLVAASLANLIIRDSDPFKPSKEANFSNLDSYYKQNLKWRDCYSEFQCAMYKVPINYEDIALGDFNIAVMKHSAPDAIGNLVINPGGPGGSGIDYAYSYQDVFTPKITNKFNLIGFDPRGVSRSAPIKCLNDAETDSSYASDSYPENDAEMAELRSDSAKYAKNCSNDNKYLKYYGTANAARDMDILRALLGDEKLNFLGKSYGTYLGTLYAKLFPNNVGRFVLDGAVDPTLSSMQQSLQQAVGFDEAFKSFADSCLSYAECVLTKDYLNQLRSKLSEIREKPIKVGERKLTESLAMYGIAMGLYDKELGWPELRSALKELFAGKGKALLSMADAYTGRDANGNYQSNEADAISVISCNDFPVSRIDFKTTTNAAPLFGKYVAYGDITCEYLPHGKFELVDGPVNINSPTLVIGTTNDPATPYNWAVKLSRLLNNSILISLNSDGHTGYSRGSACVDQVVEKYLISGVIPAQNLACSA